MALRVKHAFRYVEPTGNAHQGDPYTEWMFNKIESAYGFIVHHRDPRFTRPSLGTCMG